MRNTKTVFKLFVATGLGLSFSLLTACGGGGSSDSDPVVTTLPNCTTSSIPPAVTGGIWTYSATDSRECRAITTAVNCKSNQVRVRIPVTNSNRNTPLATNTPFINQGNSQQSCDQQSNGKIICGTTNNNYGNNYNNNNYGNNYSNNNYGNNYSNNNYGNNYNNNNNYGNNYNNNYQVNNQTNYHTSTGGYTEVCMDQNSQDWYYVVNAGNYYYLNYSLYRNNYQNYQQQYYYHYQKQLSPKQTLITFGVLATALFLLSN